MSLLRSSRTVTVTGPVDLDTAWRGYTDTANWLRWSPQIRWLSVAGEPLAAGLTGRVGFSRAVSVDFTVTSLDPQARRWTWRVLAGLVELEHEVHPVGNGTAAVVIAHAPLPVLLGYEPLMRLALRRLVAGRWAHPEPAR